MKAVIVTSCPSGIANTIITASVLAKTASDLQWQVAIECQNSVKSVEPLSDTDIDAAEVVILFGKPNGMKRFDSKMVFQAKTEDCYKDPRALLEQAAEKASLYEHKQIAEIQSVSMNSQKRVVGITACPTGVAHTFMAAEALEAEGIAQGIAIKIETRGSVGAKNQLTDEEIEKADLVFIGADIEVDLSRFAGKRVYKTSTSAALKKTKEELAKAFDTAEIYQHGVRQRQILQRTLKKQVLINI